MISLYALVISKFSDIKGFLMYADDGRIFPEEEEVSLSRRKGIQVKLEKPNG